MKTIKIIKMSDTSTSCDMGCWGGEEGGQVYIDGELIYEYIPSAGCFGNVDVTFEDLVKELLSHLGYSLEIEEQDISEYGDQDEDF